MHTSGVGGSGVDSRKVQGNFISPKLCDITQAMLNHGLDTPVLDQQDGFFVVILPGPAGNYDRLRPPTDTASFITPAMEAKLNERQRKIILHIQEEGFVTNKWVQDTFNVVRDTAYRDIQLLVDLNVIERRGRGRSISYVLARDRA